MRIDVHTHFQSLAFIKHLLGRSGLPRSVRDGGTHVIQCASGLKQRDCPAEDRELIYHGNAERLLKLKQRAVAA